MEKKGNRRRLARSISVNDFGARLGGFILIFLDDAFSAGRRCCST